MTVPLTRTKAEQAFPEMFEALAARLPGGPAVAAARKTAIGTFAALGLPHRRVEEWKYTDLRALLKEAFAPAVDRPIAVNEGALYGALGPGLAGLDAVRVVFVNGAFAPGLTRLDDQHGRSYHFDPLTRGLAEGFDWLEALISGTEGPKGGAVVALNTAFATDGALLRIVDGARMQKPVHLIFVTAGVEKAGVTTRNFIKVGEGAEAMIVESHIALGAAASQDNAVTEIGICDRARVRHVKVLAGPDPAASAHLGTWIVGLGAQSEYHAFQFTAGMPLVRNQLLVAFGGEGGKLDIAGCFLGRGAEHIDTTLVIDHAVPGCTSRELVKGVLADRARGVFQGKVIVRPDAQKTDGKQMAQALMLSEEAEFDSKPELEILADDVVCGHGSTAAQLDESLLFYLRSRGIPLPEARALLIESFVGEVFDKLEDGPLREALLAIAKARLSGLTG
jgi:Fe-S cluster assembly protein SufD